MGFDDIDLEDELQHRFQVIQGFPAHLIGRFRQAARVPLEARHNAVRNDHTMEVRAWKLFLLLSFMLLRTARGVGEVGKDEMSRRFDKFSEGQWRILWEEAKRAVQRIVPERHQHDSRKEDTSGLSEGSSWRDVQSTTLFDRGVRPLPWDVLEFEPEVPVELDRATFLTSVFSLGPRGCTYEHLKVLYDEYHTMELLLADCTSVAQAKVPAKMRPALMSARLTVLAKPDGGVRGIATGSSVRRLVGKSLGSKIPVRVGHVYRAVRVPCCCHFRGKFCLCRTCGERPPSSIHSFGAVKRCGRHRP